MRQGSAAGSWVSAVLPGRCLAASVRSAYWLVAAAPALFLAPGAAGPGRWGKSRCCDVERPAKEAALVDILLDKRGLVDCAGVARVAERQQQVWAAVRRLGLQA